jgi:hypothetical protein
MKISYAITVCNEFIEIQRLVSFLLQHKRSQDEIVILYDEANGDPEVENYLRSHSINGEFNWHKAKFKQHFADWKNKLSSLCSGDYIFQIDADEILLESTLQIISNTLELNNVDIILVPRINTIEGLTQEHIQKWGWRVDEKGWVNFPDYQWRIYRNTPEIKWINKVHEILSGFKTMAQMPADPEYALIHPKTIEKQEKQNNYYESI